jgi:hypothetical protein
MSPGGWLPQSGQRWKVRTAYALAAVQWVALLAAFLFKESDQVLVASFWTLGLALVGFGILVLWARCRACGEFVLLWSLRHNRPLRRLGACPGCGARGSSLESSGPSLQTESRVDLDLFRTQVAPRRNWLLGVIVSALVFSLLSLIRHVMR